MRMKFLRHNRFWLILTVLGLDALFFTLTDPNKVPSVLLMVGFVLLALTVYYASTGIVALCGLYGLSFGKHNRRIALFVTAGIGCLLALQSIGELTARDALVLLPLVILFYVYLSYGRVPTKP